MDKMLIIKIGIFLLLNVNHVFGGSCGPMFPDKCICGKELYEGEMKYVVNCTDTGLRNTTVLENLPEETEVLIFTGNYIPELKWNIFGNINDYASLTVIDMSNNHIHEIRGKSYHHVTNVQRLLLNHNNLSISRYDGDENHHHPRVFSNFINLESLHLTDAFSDNTSSELSADLHDIFVNSNLTKLFKLHLEQNEISSFKDPRVFCDLPNLNDLHLSDNNLKEINFNLQCLHHLRFLDLQRNNFENIQKKDLTSLDALSVQPRRTTHFMVDFSLNPFVCDCRISPLHNWLKLTPVSVRNKENLMCYRNRIYPESIVTIQTGKCSLSDPQPLQNLNRTTGHTVTLVFLLAILISILIGLVAALIYISRDKIKYFITPVLDTVSKKVQYTTIKDEECPEVHV